jgi:tripartite-type tricarboxylate transporter receptor subunit TctC
MFPKLFVAMAACTLAAAPLAAQTYPSKPITLVVPFAPDRSMRSRAC